MATNDPAFDIVAQLEVEADGFARDLRKAEKDVAATTDKMQSSFERNTESVGKLQVGLAAAGAAGTLAGSSFGGVASAAAGFAGALQALNLGLGPIGIALTAVGLAALQFKDVFLGSDEAASTLDVTIGSLEKKLYAARTEFELFTGSLTNADVRAREFNETVEAITASAERSALHKFFFTHPNVQKDIDKTTKSLIALAEARRKYTEDRIAGERADKIDKKITDGITKQTAELKANEKAAASRDEQVRTGRRAIQLSADVLAGRTSENEALIRTHGILQGIFLIDQKRARLAEFAAGQAESAAKSQRQIEQSLARSLLIKAGERTQADYANSETERTLLQALAAASGGTKVPEAGAGFSISTRQASEFRGFKAGDNLQLGAQTEQKKTNILLEENNKISAEALAVARRNEGNSGVLMN